MESWAGGVNPLPQPVRFAVDCCDNVHSWQAWPLQDGEPWPIVVVRTGDDQPSLSNAPLPCMLEGKWKLPCRTSLTMVDTRPPRCWRPTSPQWCGPSPSVSGQTRSTGSSTTDTSTLLRWPGSPPLERSAPVGRDTRASDCTRQQRNTPRRRSVRTCWKATVSCGRCCQTKSPPRGRHISSSATASPSSGTAGGVIDSWPSWAERSGTPWT